MQGLADGGFVEIRDRIALDFWLQALTRRSGKEDSTRSGDFFFDEEPDPAFDFVQKDVTGWNDTTDGDCDS